MNTVGTTTDSAAREPSTNPHVLWRQLLGLVLWLGIMGFLAGRFVGVAAALLLGGVTFADAWTSGIYKSRNSKSFLNMSPMGWGIVMAMLFLVAYPLYLINRNKLRTRNNGNGFFIATIVVGACVFVLLMVLGVTTNPPVTD